MIKDLKAEHAAILDACKPVPYMVMGGREPSSPQENANHAWQSLGRTLGFKWDTVQPVFGSCELHFTAEAIDEAQPAAAEGR